MTTSDFVTLLIVEKATRRMQWTEFCELIGKSYGVVNRWLLPEGHPWKVTPDVLIMEAIVARLKRE